MEFFAAAAEIEPARMVLSIARSRDLPRLRGLADLEQEFDSGGPDLQRESFALWLQLPCGGQLISLRRDPAHLSLC